MKKYIFTLFALSALYIAIYIINILFVIINYSALLIGRSPSLFRFANFICRLGASSGSCNCSGCVPDERCIHSSRKEITNQ